MIFTTTYNQDRATMRLLRRLRKAYWQADVQGILRKLGANRYDLKLPESRALIEVMEPGEQIAGIVFGRYVQGDGLVGRGALVATDTRVLLLDKKPMFMRCEEIEYHVISAVERAGVGFIHYVTLHTRMGDIKIRTFNGVGARRFVDSVGSRLFADDRTTKTDGD
jgi:hypothetical protein